MPYLLLRGLSHSAIACLLLLLTACAEAPAQPLVAAPITASTRPCQPNRQRGQQSNARYSVLMNGACCCAAMPLLPASTPLCSTRTFADITLDPRVVSSDNSQPEFTRPVWEYIDGAVSVSRIALGRLLKAQHRPTLKAIRSTLRRRP